MNARNKDLGVPTIQLQQSIGRARLSRSWSTAIAVAAAIACAPELLLAQAALVPPPSAGESHFPGEPVAPLLEAPFTLSATGQFESNDNVFDLQGGYPIPGTTDYRRADTDFVYGATSQLAYIGDRQQVSASISGQEYRYNTFTQLNRSQYKLEGDWNWQLGSVLDGLLQTYRTRSMVTFLDVSQAVPVQQTEQRESALIGVPITPDWRVEANGYTRLVDEPILQAPDLHLRENSGALSLKYVGNAGLTAGVTGGELYGIYTGVTAQAYSPEYRQTNFDVLANYSAKGPSNFTGALGYTDRTSAAAIDHVAGATGLLNYSNQLTAKSSVNLTLMRGINNFFATAGSEFDSVAAINAIWRATYKTTVQLGYSWLYRQLPGQGNQPTAPDRVDHVQTVSLTVTYQPLRWLSIQPYATVQTRGSNFVGGNFDDTIFGVILLARWDYKPLTKAAP